MRDKVTELIMAGDLVIGSDSPDTADQVLKHKVNKKRQEIEERLRAVLASDLINVRQYVSIHAFKHYFIIFRCLLI